MGKQNPHGSRTHTLGTLLLVGAVLRPEDWRLLTTQPHSLLNLGFDAHVHTGAGHACGMAIAILAASATASASECCWYIIVYLLDSTQVSVGTHTPADLRGESPAVMFTSLHIVTWRCGFTVAVSLLGVHFVWPRIEQHMHERYVWFWFGRVYGVSYYES